MSRVPIHRTRCWRCRTAVLPFAGHVSYFSFSRGGWWRVPLCRKCVAEVLTERREHQIAQP
jgi:hypothetical protein